MKKLILLSLLLFIGCEETLEPEDCAGVAGGTAVEDNCGTCDSDLTNDNTTCIQDGCGAWGGNGFNSQGYYCTDINILRDIIQSSDWESAGEQTWNNIVDLSDSPMKRLIQFKINQSNVIIPDNIGGLSEITQFWIYNCNLNNIPYEIGNLNKLIDLGLMYNNLSGNILASLGNIKTLEILDLTGNQFTGTIPDTIYTLSNLKDLWLPYNDLSGEIKLLKGKNAAPPSDNKTAVKNVPIGNSMVLGNPKAPITVVKWTDFQ